LDCDTHSQSIDLLSLPFSDSPSEEEELTEQCSQRLRNRLWELPDTADSEGSMPDEGWIHEWADRQQQKKQMKQFVKQMDMDELITNGRGGRQSKIAGDFTLLPHAALEQAAIVLEEGCAKYGACNWKNIPLLDHMNHAYRHLSQASELFYRQANSPAHGALLEELSHALVRTMFCIDRLIANDLSWRGDDES
jgi:hypothetical protein